MNGNGRARAQSGAGVIFGMSMSAGAMMMAGSSAGAAAPSASQEPSGFSAEVVVDPETKWDIIVLRHRDASDPHKDLEVSIAPFAGSNLFSFKTGGHELIMQPPKLAGLIEQHAGTPVMFPIVNRVRDAKMTFEGRAFTFEPNNGKNFIHGFARRRPFALGPVTSDARGAHAKTVLEWNESAPEWKRFPIKHRLTISYTLGNTAVSIGYRVDNLDASRLPFAFGLHPYFKIPSARGEVTITVPAEKRMEAVDMLPTGTLLPVSGTPYDLRKGASLAALALDDVYFGVTPHHPAAFSFAAPHLQITLAGSADFTHLVVYTPPDKGFFCVENQTSSTDAVNLAAAGKKTEAHLLVVDPGKHSEGTVTWTVHRT